MNELTAKLKEQIIEELCLEDLTSEDIEDTEPLFGDGLGLDSIDALSLVVLLDREYGIEIDDPQKGKDIFFSIETIASYIAANKT